MYVAGSPSVNRNSLVSTLRSQARAKLCSRVYADRALMPTTIAGGRGKRRTATAISAPCTCCATGLSEERTERPYQQRPQTYETDCLKFVRQKYRLAAEAGGGAT